MPMWIFDKIGWFASEFFIDWVDIEYCFRIREAGYLIVESWDAILLHEPGHPYHLRFWVSASGQVITAQCGATICRETASWYSGSISCFFLFAR